MNDFAPQAVQTMPVEGDAVVVDLVGVPMKIVDHPAAPGAKAMLVGPIVFALSMDAQAAATIAEGLTHAQILVAPAHALNGTPLH